MSFLIRVVIVAILSPLLILQPIDAYAKNSPLASLAGRDLQTGKSIQLDLSPSQPDAAVVVFLSSECPCSLSHMSHIKNLVAENNKVKFIGILSNEGEDLTEAKVQLKDAGFPIILDKAQAYANAFGAAKTPHVFLLQNGKIIFHGGVSDSNQFGNAKEQFLKIALKQMSAGEAPKPDFARALGCEIRRR